MSLFAFLAIKHQAQATATTGNGDDPDSKWKRGCRRGPLRLLRERLVRRSRVRHSPIAAAQARHRTPRGRGHGPAQGELLI